MTTIHRRHLLAAACAKLAFGTHAAQAQTFPDKPVTHTGPLSVVQGALNVSFTLTSAVGGIVPFTVGHAFKQGDVPSGSTVAIGGATAQYTAKNAWPDGSLKYAVIAGTASLTAGVPGTVSLTSSLPSSGSPLTLSQLKAAMTQPVTISAGAFGSASWSDTDWDTPFETWISGHRMSSWVYRKQVGSDAHLVAWLEVRYYATGAVEVLPWVENCNVLPANTAKSATYTFTMGGTQRYSGALTLEHHNRTPLISGTVVSHWLGTDPGVVPLHDPDYLQSTGLVPAYMAKTSPTSSQVLGLPTTFAPLMVGSHPAGMGSGGYSPSIGLLPEWDVLHLTCNNATTYRGVIFNAYNVGRYLIHYRDEKDSYRPIRLSQHPTTLLPESTPGTVQYAISHQPAFAYLAYLITGRRYLCEQVQMQAGANSLFEQVANRQNGNGIVLSQAAGSIRHAAWGIRTLCHALTVTPDSDTTMKTEFRNQITNNVAYYHGRYVAQPANVYGWVQPYQGVGGYGDTSAYFDGPWMQDFFTATLGYMKDMGLGLDATNTTRLDALFSWKAQSIVGRFGGTGATEWLYRDATPYALAIAPAEVNWDTYNSAQWYPTWKAAYNATYTPTGTPTYDSSAAPYLTPGPIAEGDIRVRPFLQEGAHAEAIPALAYAVKHGATGAEEAWGRLTNAGNWAAFEALIDIQPVWAVAPRALPKWVRGMAVNQWREIPNSRMQDLLPTRTVWNAAQPDIGLAAHQTQRTNGANLHNNRLNGYCGMTADTRRSTLWTFLAGGHGDYWQNEATYQDLRDDAPTWKMKHAGSNGDVIYMNEPAAGWRSVDLRYYLDGLPCAKHTYYNTIFVERHNRVVLTGGSISPNGGGKDWVESFNVDAGTNDNAGFSAVGAYPDSVAGARVIGMSVAKDPRYEVWYCFSNGGVHAHVPSVGGPTATPGSGATRTFYSLAGANWNSAYPFQEGATAIDTARNKLLWTHGYHENSTTIPVLIDLANLTHAGLVRPTYTGAAAAAMAAIGTSCGLVYVPRLDKYLLRGDPAGAHVYQIDPATFSVTTLSTTGGTSIPEGQGSGTVNGTYNKWQHLPALRGVVYLPGADFNTWFLRLY